MVHSTAGALQNAPYIHTDAQVRAWKKVRIALHLPETHRLKFPIPHRS